MCVGSQCSNYEFISMEVRWQNMGEIWILLLVRAGRLETAATLQPYYSGDKCGLVVGGHCAPINN